MHATRRCNTQAALSRHEDCQCNTNNQTSKQADICVGKQEGTRTRGYLKPLGDRRSREVTENDALCKSKVYNTQETQVRGQSGALERLARRRRSTARRRALDWTAALDVLAWDVGASDPFRCKASGREMHIQSEEELGCRAHFISADSLGFWE